ncbi:hypothetical protein BJ138DRAFT_511799 [Hygrophoropsis aurantiaca]|uniref:Uncharacterized protein n=1 Tax=Hygrophoropsis aurantiaca TaxID=72124 RepID=A0ACB8A1B4_9AGAM|nr:hypothetical protein BJ138DRAFT_511799 [Hygrophoropsis aurantiaca]
MSFTKVRVSAAYVDPRVKGVTLNLDRNVTVAEATEAVAEKVAANVTEGYELSLAEEAPVTSLDMKHHRFPKNVRDEDKLSAASPHGMMVIFRPVDEVRQNNLIQVSKLAATQSIQQAIDELRSGRDKADEKIRELRQTNRELRQTNRELRQTNKELRQTIEQRDQTIRELGETVRKQGRKIEALERKNEALEREMGELRRGW